MFPQIFGKYVLERELASGGMAIVYLATLRGAGGFEKRLVVKQIRAELASDGAFVERFVAEAKTTVELSHPNIVPVYELGVEQGVYFIAMELALGVTLSELLQTGGRLSPEEGAYLGVEIGRALDYAHRKGGIVHRDVTPRNVLVDEEGAVRLIDFGIAAPVSVAGSARERVYGSPGHMPPEQLSGGRLTPATDVFAMGALLIEAWTTVPAFRRATKAESDAALATPPPALSTTAPELLPLDELFARAVSPTPSERPQSAEDLARPLREFLRSADVGDIARRLGERVRCARSALAGTSPDDRARATPAASRTPVTPAAAQQTPVTPAMAHSERSSRPPGTPSTRPLTQPVTETFASRDEVVEWTRPSSRPPAGAPIGTPALAPALAAAPRMGSAGEGRARRLWPLAMLVAVASVGLLRWGLGGPASTPDEGAVAPLPRVAPSAPLRPPAPPTLALTASSAPSTSASASPAQAAVGSEVVPSAVYSFTSDLPARVSLDGAAQGTTPIRSVRKPAGKHAVRFVSLELGEELTTSVVTSPGQSVGVHAEFTRAVPGLRVR